MSAVDARTQWTFPRDSLCNTPATGVWPLHKELFERAKGIEFLYRVGLSLMISLPAMLTAAVYFHRFYMRHSIADYHTIEMAATCVFLASKIEENSRKVKDVTVVTLAKWRGTNANDVAQQSKDFTRMMATILAREEILVEALCLDFLVNHPHADLCDLFESWPEDGPVEPPDCLVEDFAWSIANDSYRTPLCVLYAPNIIAMACFALAVHLAMGIPIDTLESALEDGASASPLLIAADALKARDAASCAHVMDSLVILLEFYSSQPEDNSPPSEVCLTAIYDVAPPATTPGHVPLFLPYSEMNGHASSLHSTNPSPAHPSASRRTPLSDGDQTPGDFSIAGSQHNNVDTNGSQNPAD